MSRARLEILYIGETAEIMEQIRTLGIPGVSFSICSNAMEAVRFLTSGRFPDGILCDPAVPGATAFEINKFIREKLGMRTPAFILVSNVFRDELYINALKEKIDDFYVFPIDSAASLIDRIDFIREHKVRMHKLYPDEVKNVPRYFMPLSKRIFDLVVASAALIILLPFLLLITIAIRLESKGKVYYVSRRVGRGIFDFYKLRSMKEDAENELTFLASEKNQYKSSHSRKEIDFTKACPRCLQRNGNGPCSPLLHISNHTICEYWYQFQKHEIEKSTSSFIKIQDDPRITRVGKVIRNLSIDELPQLINVLKGDMSLVGNRPLPIYEAEKLTFDQMAKRFLAPAGLTGLWQVELRGRGGKMSEEERKKLDNEYADVFLKNQYSLWYDLKLILRTIPAIFQKETV